MEKKLFSFDEIKSKILKYCVYQERCHLEVEAKLKEFVLIPEAKDQIMLMLIEHDFLNEVRFAHAYARGKFYQKNWGKLKIKAHMKQKGISEKLIDKALANEIDADDYLKTARKLCEKKLGELSAPLSYLQKSEVYKILYAKGYESNTIQVVLEEFSG
jgi:regulatory protein